VIATAVALVLSASLSVACGDTGIDAGGTPPPSHDIAVTSIPSDSPPDPSRPREVEPEEGLVNVTPTVWTKAKVASDELSARLTWYSGVEECYGLDRAEVDYHERTIDITLFSGSRPEAETCIELAEKVVTVVELDEPVGGRELVDGARPD
jgi:hypothetical protein